MRKRRLPNGIYYSVEKHFPSGILELCAFVDGVDRLFRKKYMLYNRKDAMSEFKNFLRIELFGSIYPAGNN